MKPCSNNRKLIVWLALGALEDRKAAALRLHLARCADCRSYWEKISNMAEGLALAAPDSDLEASEFFHHRVAEKLQAVESNSILEDLAVWLRRQMLNWRVAVPAVGLVVIAFFAIVALHNPPNLPLPATPVAQVVPASGSEGDLAPTLANYQMTASQSLEKLSELLTRQGNKSLSPTPLYTASSFGLVNGSF
jgi:hypothetical protein